MKIDELKSLGRDVMGVTELVSVNGKLCYQTIPNARIWKCGDNYYYVENDSEVTMLNTTYPKNK